MTSIYNGKQIPVKAIRQNHIIYKDVYNNCSSIHYNVYYLKRALTHAGPPRALTHAGPPIFVDGDFVKMSAYRYGYLIPSSHYF